MVGHETKAIHPGSEAKYALGHLTQLEIRPQELVVDVKHRVFLLVAVVAVIPRHDFHGFALKLTGKRGQSFHLIALHRQIGVTQLVQHVIDGLRLLGHRVLQLILCIALASHQAGNLQAGVGDVTQHVKIAVLTTGALPVIHQVQLLAQVTPVTVFHEGDIAGSVQSYQPGVLAPLILCGLFGRIECALGQATQVIGSEPQLIL